MHFKRRSDVYVQVRGYCCVKYIINTFCTYSYLENFTINLLCWKHFFKVKLKWLHILWYDNITLITWLTLKANAVLFLDSCITYYLDPMRCSFVKPCPVIMVWFIFFQSKCFILSSALSLCFKPRKTPGKHTYIQF